jgi:hypothetical protein
MRGRRLWCKVPTMRGPLSVYVVRPGACTLDGDKVDAHYDAERNEIWVETKPQEQTMRQTLFHELVHVCFGGTTVEVKEKFLGAKNPDVIEQREELLAGFLEMTLFDLLTRNGWLKLPKPPKVGGKKVDHG